MSKKRSNKHWTKDEVTFLRRWFSTRGEYWVSEQLGRSVRAVQAKARNLYLEFGVTAKYQLLMEVAYAAGRNPSVVMRAAERAGALQYFDRGRSGRYSVRRDWAEQYLEAAERVGDVQEYLDAGFVGVEQIARETGMSDETIRKHLREPSGLVGELFEGLTSIREPGVGLGRGYLFNPHDVVRVRERMDWHRKMEREGVALRELAEEFGMELNTLVEVAEEAGVEVMTVLATRVLKPTRFIRKEQEGEVRAAVARWMHRPEGALSVRDAAEEWGVSYQLILNAAQRMNLSLPQYRMPGSNQLALFIPAELQAKLREEVSLPPVAPSGYILLGRLCKELGLPSGEVLRLCRRHKVEVKEFRSRHVARVREYVFGRHAQRVREAVAKRRAAPEGWLTIQEMSEKVGLSETTIGRIVKEGNYRRRGTVRRDGTGFVYYYSRNAQKAVEKEAAKRVPAPDSLSAAEMAEELGLTHRQVDSIITNLELTGELRVRRDGGGMARYYTPEAFAAVRDYYERDQPPADALDVGELSERYQRTTGEVKGAIKELGLKPRKWTARGNAGGQKNYYTSSQVKKLDAHFQARDKSVSRNEIAKATGASVTSVTRYLQAEGIEPLFGGNGTLKLYAPEALKKALRHFAEVVPPKGHVTAAQIAKKTGLTLNVVNRCLERLAVAPSVGKKGSKLYYRPEIIGIVAAEAEKLVPPQGYVAVADLAAEVGRDRDFVLRRFKRLGIEAPFGGEPGVARHYSPEQRLELLKSLGVTPPEDLRQAA